VLINIKKWIFLIPNKSIIFWWAFSFRNFPWILIFPIPAMTFSFHFCKITLMMNLNHSILLGIQLELFSYFSSHFYHPCQISIKLTYCDKLIQHFFLENGGVVPNNVSPNKIVEICFWFWVGNVTNRIYTSEIAFQYVKMLASVREIFYIFHKWQKRMAETEIALELLKSQHFFVCEKVCYL